MSLTVEQAFEQALRHHRAGELAPAEQIYRQILAVQPQHADSLHLLGVIAHSVGQHESAIGVIRQAISLNPRVAIYHSNLGEALRMAGQAEAALAANLEALRLDPNLSEAHNNVGVLLASVRRFAEAIPYFQRAATLNPQFVDAFYNLAQACQDTRQYEAALEAYRATLALAPQHAVAWNSFGTVFMDTSRYDEAIAAFRQAIELEPTYEIPYNNIGCAYRAMGQMSEAVPNFRRAAEMSPHHPHILANLIYSLYFHHGETPVSIAVEQRKWRERFADPYAPLRRAHANDRSPERRLKIGYVSPDFWAQAESYFVVPLLEAHDRTQFEIHCYASVQHPDETTVRYQRGGNVWHDVVQFPDVELAEQIRADGIDILVDLTMHMAHTRLGLFAQKPAPVQVTWLAYPGSTGLNTIDFRITDSFMDPPALGTDGCTEESVRMPHAWCCYHPLIDLPPSPATRVAGGEGICFGSLNGPGKLNEPTMRVWARVLLAVPGARLLLLADEGSARDSLRGMLARVGVPGERVDFVPLAHRAEYLRNYDRIDIALDPLPYNGITTTCDALWMGVPVVTLTGDVPWARAGQSLLTTVGVPELVTTTEEDFVRCAVELARDEPRRALLRSTLRARMAASPLMDAPAFARAFEAAYRDMWRRWCAS